MAKPGKKAAKAIILAQKLVRIKRADGGETDPMQDSDYTSPPDKPNYVMSTEPTKPVLTPDTFYERANSVLKERAKDFGQGLSEFPAQAYEYMKAPMQALRGETQKALDPNTGKIIDVLPSGMSVDEAAMGGAGLISTGALPDIMAGKVTPNVTRMFAGPKAATADLNSLNIAREMMNQGKAAEDVFNKTGWFEGKDNMWRHEISDANSSLNLAPLREPSKSSYLLTSAKLGDVLDHPDLYEAYPWLKNTDVILDPETTANAYYNTREGTIGINPNLSDKDAHLSVLHEVMHAIQENEGYGRGYSPNPKRALISGTEENARYKKMINSYTPEEMENLGISKQKIMDLVANSTYMTNSGEVEARNVPHRFSNPTKKFPTKTEDTPREYQWVRPNYYAHGGKTNTLIDTALMLMSRKT